MPKTVYRVIRQEDHFAVEMLSPSGERYLIPDFRDQHEADAWIVQTKRLRSLRDPRDRFRPRPKEGAPITRGDSRRKDAAGKRGESARKTVANGR